MRNLPRERGLRRKEQAHFKNSFNYARVCGAINEKWVKYDNPELGIIAEDEDGVHNAIILRSNITSEKYPDGVFHAHPEFHVIKKESLGLIEAQGLCKRNSAVSATAYSKTPRCLRIKSRRLSF